MPKSTPAAWTEARSRWEADPSFTLTQVAEMLGVKLPTVSERAKRDNWLKLSAQAEERDMAHQVSDVIGQIAGRDDLLDAVGAALDLSVSTRVLVINKQRQDWNDHRRLFPTEAMAADPVCAKRAKLAAEALALRQRGEAIAYGIVTMTGQSTDAPLVETIEEAKERPRWEILLESYATTGKAPAEFQVPRISNAPEVDPDEQ